MTFLLLSIGIAFAQPDAKKDFQSILEKVGNEHPRVMAAQYRALATKSAQLSNVLAWTPSIRAQATQPIRVWGSQGLDSATVDVGLNLFKFGGDYARVRGGLKAREQADITSELAILDAETKAAQLIFSWIEAQYNLNNQRTLLTNKRELIRVAQTKFQRGQLPEQDVEKVRLDASNLEVQLRQAEVTFLDLKSQMEAWMPGSTALQTWPWSSLAKNGNLKKQKSLQDRFNYRNLELSSEIQSYKKWEAKSNWLPSLDLNSRWGTNELFPLEKGEWYSALTLTIPLWDQGTTLASVNSTAYAQKAAESDLQVYKREEEARLQTLNERREKLRQNLLIAVESNQKSKSLAAESLRRFQMGRASVNDLLLDQQRFFDSESLAQQAQRQYHLILLEDCLGADERPSRCF